ncbi:SMI1/KNR4 family protein [Nocardia sp. NPDC056100]|uniref:SMI1/KNR4 family protein n=1 Tax=Nocardia sp. NPDC056100 TaxID=3345712 RepID=UPI0035D5DD61
MRVLEVFAEYVSWLRLNVPLAYENLAGPAHPSELAALEDAIGHELPAAVKAVLGMHNGQAVPSLGYYEHGVPAIPSLTFMSTTEIRTVWEFWDAISDDPSTIDLQEIGATYPAAKGLIKPLWTSPGWIPLWAHPQRSDYIGVDLDPGPAGTSGQIINFGRDEERHFRGAPNFTDLIEFLLEEVTSGHWPATVFVREGEDGEEEPTPWFGDHAKSFFNTLYDRYETRPRH